MNDNLARTIGTVGIWIAVTVILTFGVFRATWNSDLALVLMVFVVLLVCGAATKSTAVVWGLRTSKGTSVRPPDRDRQE